MRYKEKLGYPWPIRLEPEMVKALKTIAAKEETTLPALIRRLLRKALNKRK